MTKRVKGDHLTEVATLDASLSEKNWTKSFILVALLFCQLADMPFSLLFNFI